MNWVKDTVITYAVAILIKILALLAGILVARTLGPEGKGEFAMLLLVPMTLIALGDLGIRQSSKYLLAREKKSISKVFSSSVLAALVLGVILMSLAAAGFFIFNDSFLRGLRPEHYFMMVAVIPAWLLLVYVIEMFRGIQRPLAWNLTRFMETALWLGLLLVGFLLVSNSLTSALAARLIALLLTLGLALGLLYWSKRRELRWDLDRRVTLTLGTRGAQFAFVLAFGFLNRRAGTFMVNGYLDMAEVGFYVVALSVVEIIWLFPDSIGAVLFPLVCRSSEEEAKRFTPTACRYTLLVTSVIALGIFVVAGPLITLLYGNAFAPAVAPLLILLPGVVFLSIHKVLWRDFMAHGRPLYALYSRGLTLVALITLSIFLIPAMGLAGAALAATISYILGTAALIFLYSRLSGVSWYKTVIPERGDLVRLITTVGVVGQRLLSIRGIREGNNTKARNRFWRK